MPDDSRPRSIPIRNLLLIPLFFALVATASVDSATLRPTIGFDGWFHSGAWTPVRVEVETETSPFRGELVISVPRSTLRSMAPAHVDVTLPVNLEPRARSVQWITVPLAASPHSLRTQLRSASGRTIDAVDVGLLDKATRDPIVLILDPNEQSWAWLNVERGTPQGAPALSYGFATGPAFIPEEALGLFSLSALWITSHFPMQTLSPKQEEALQKYVEYGGHLVLIGGAQPPSFSKTWDAWLGSAVSPGIHHISVPDGRRVPAWELVSASEPGKSTLYQTFRRGAGRITLLAASPHHLGVRSLLSIEEWSRILRADETHSVVHTGPSGNDTFWGILDSATVSTRVPTLVIGSMFAYLALIVGLLYGGVRTPALLAALPLVIVTGAYGISKQTSTLGLRERVSYAEIQLTHGVAEGVVVNRTYGILGSHGPKGATVRLHTPPPFPFPASYKAVKNVSTLHTSTSLLVDESPLRLTHESWYELPVYARFSDRSEGSVIVRNDSHSPLRHAFLISTDQYVPLGTIPAHGERREALRGQTSAAGIADAVENTLERLSLANRPHPFEIKALAAAVTWTLTNPIVPGHSRNTFVIALMNTDAALSIEPYSHQRLTNVIIIPAFEVDPGVIEGSDPT